MTTIPLPPNSPLPLPIGPHFGPTKILHGEAVVAALGHDPKAPSGRHLWNLAGTAVFNWSNAGPSRDDQYHVLEFLIPDPLTDKDDQDYVPVVPLEFGALVRPEGRFAVVASPAEFSGDGLGSAIWGVEWADADLDEESGRIKLTAQLRLKGDSNGQFTAMAYQISFLTHLG